MQNRQFVVLCVSGVLSSVAMLPVGCATATESPVQSPSVPAIVIAKNPEPEQITVLEPEQTAEAEARRRIVEEAHKYFPEPSTLAGRVWTDFEIKAETLDGQMVVLEIGPEQEIKTWRPLLNAYITAISPADLPPDMKYYLSRCPVDAEGNNFLDYIEKWVDKIILCPRIVWRSTNVPVLAFTDNYYSRSLYAGQRLIYINTLFDFTGEVPYIQFYRLLVFMVHEAAHKEYRYLFDNLLLPEHIRTRDRYDERYAQIMEIIAVRLLLNMPDFPEAEKKSLQYFINNRLRDIAGMSTELGLSPDNLLLLPPPE